MIKIYKYILELTEEQTLKLPSNFTLLKVAEQDKKLCLWAKVDTEKRLDSLHISIIGTGHQADKDLFKWEYMDTVLMSNGFVWHIFYYKNDWI